jgi:hypothetical protein
MNRQTDTRALLGTVILASFVLGLGGLAVTHALIHADRSDDGFAENACGMSACTGQRSGPDGVAAFMTSTSGSNWAPTSCSEIHAPRDLPDASHPPCPSQAAPRMPWDATGRAAALEYGAQLTTPSHLP